MNASGDTVDLLGMLPSDLEVFLQALGEPRYRARQLFSRLHRGAAFEEMTDLPRGLRSRLAALARPGTLALVDRLEAPDGTAKVGFQTADGHTIETVLIPHGSRTTICVSSQIGCAFACAFCATGRPGLTCSLRPGEIVEQVVQVQKSIRPTRLSNIVFMGMGEPLANYAAVMKAIRILNSEQGLAIGARHIAISTCGLPNEIRRLAREGLQVALAISLHAATDDVRNRLVPINRKYNIAELMAAARFFVRETGRKVAFEYVVVPGANDTPEQARELARLLRGLPSMVNLIPRNPIEEGGRANPDAAFRFAAFLKRHGLEAVVRRSRGAEVLGACGQLGSSEGPRKSRARSLSPGS
ncbi:MAG TPA: 23S rRNA (adenine(2503)-C(2))-methyltransferase RlmN [Armatimonadota bacterium]|nr:23S rRNA (adenine(2503)-C(2))-methyltransferase RlmN [Armatimonadota bacterium]